MNIRNYTSSVPVVQTVSHIEMMLVQFGAQHIAKSYAGTEITALTFSLPIGDKFQAVQLPVNAAKVQTVLQAQKKRGKVPEGQAQRTAWKLMAEWVHIQLSLIQMGQAEPAEVFLPYMFNGKQTYFQALAANDFKQLTFSGDAK